MNEVHPAGEPKSLSEQIQRDGYVVLRNLMDSQELEHLLNHADNFWDTLHDPQRPQSKLEVHGAAVAQIASVRMAACKKRLIDTVLTLLGPNIYVNYIGFTINPPQSEDKQHMAYHQDGGRISKEHAQFFEPRYTVKAAIWLTDGTRLGVGNFYVIPGSHRWKQKPDTKIDELAIPVYVEPGDVILFERRVWHTRKTNTSNTRRKVLFVDYAPRWMEPKCQMDITPPPTYSSPVEEQLFNNKETWRAYAPRKIDLPALDYMSSAGLTRSVEDES
ncbi:phytanoyl-CoA dioxygenase family protein [Pseudomonas sp. COR18]|uniref:phytanoyl-CoA dioxygenase family protein n=1 Tax=Pseudomonas sp. COR18 TaxID=3399680 RepID=UPI003B00A2B4